MPDDIPSPTLTSLRTKLKQLRTCEWPSVDFNKGILWLHEKLWHAPAHKLVPLLVAGGVPHRRLHHLDEVISLCRRRADYKRPAARPQIGATLPQLGEDSRIAFQKTALTNVHTQGYMPKPIGGFLAQFEKIRQQYNRQIVNAEVVNIFKCLYGCTLPRSRKSQ